MNLSASCHVLSVKISPVGLSVVYRQVTWRRLAEVVLSNGFVAVGQQGGSVFASTGLTGVVARS